MHVKVRDLRVKEMHDFKELIKNAENKYLENKKKIDLL